MSDLTTRTCDCGHTEQHHMTAGLRIACNVIPCRCGRFQQAHSTPKEDGRG